MRKKLRFVFFVFLLGIFIVACSAGDESAQNSAGETSFDMSEPLPAMPEEQADGESFERDESGNQVAQTSDMERMVSYTAQMEIQVKDYDQALDQMVSLTTEYGGYVVESNMYGSTESNHKYGVLTVRIPQEHFQAFMEMVEASSSKVLSRNISGKDVTDEYVDLESRLKSLRVVEERLLNFLEEAEKTEDLLAISNDLADIQEEIETIVGRMKYLENRVDYATVTIHIDEYNVAISGLNPDELNTWEKTKEQFKKSINFIMTAISALIIFFVGNIPIIAILSVILFLIYFFIYRRKKE